MSALALRLPFTLRLLGRHQVGALVATAIDFVVMILGVECARLSPVLATVVGATFGAVTNFALGRRWIFRRLEEGWSGQAIRYALVAGASTGLNALGEHLVHDLAHVRYLAARILVSLVVGLLWNFPMQRHLVFR